MQKEAQRQENKLHQVYDEKLDNYSMSERSFGTMILKQQTPKPHMKQTFMGSMGKENVSEGISIPKQFFILWSINHKFSFTPVELLKYTLDLKHNL